jgi:hypothetical protein
MNKTQLPAQWEMRPTGLITALDPQGNVRFVAELVGHGDPFGARKLINEDDRRIGFAISKMPEMLAILREIVMQWSEGLAPDIGRAVAKAEKLTADLGVVIQ